MEYNPPPFFKQGPSARARLLFFSVLSLTLLVADARFNALGPIRKGMAIVLYPLQRVVLVPGDALNALSTRFAAQQRLQADNEQLAARVTTLSERSLVADSLRDENEQLRRLLGLRERLPYKSITAEILYDARDPASRKIVLDRGSSDGIQAGAPVVDDAGVVGQATRVFPFMTEVTLLTDRNQAIPVRDQRSGLRAVAYGGTQAGLLNLRFMAANADVRPGDVLLSSGIDGVYPAGLPVARVQSVESGNGVSFAQILCTPIGGVDRNRHLLVLTSIEVPAPPPPAPLPEKPHPRRGN